VVNSVKFHPNGEVLLTAGLDKMLRLFQVGGIENTKLAGICFQDLPIMDAAFTPDGKR